jgi:hypothetical protein
MAEAFVHSALLECRGECVINDPARKSFEIYDFSSKFTALFLASGLITGWEGEEFREIAENGQGSIINLISYSYSENQTEAQYQFPKLARRALIALTKS